ncbi:predicted protein [Arabidopsis lyrata subsp. lyrata]|uniref:Predicted protein n=1 Tax=Arabidopsis lyrata subsp. lyrata TaxID=81972 RepID=D7MQ14_ARALL|nr:predicted protein [Arabidopsis lyrata subsp. lyrata]
MGQDIYNGHIKLKKKKKKLERMRRKNQPKIPVKEEKAEPGWRRGRRRSSNASLARRHSRDRVCLLILIRHRVPVLRSCIFPFIFPDLHETKLVSLIPIGSLLVRFSFDSLAVDPCHSKPLIPSSQTHKSVILPPVDNSHLMERFKNTLIGLTFNIEGRSTELLLAMMPKTPSSDIQTNTRREGNYRDKRQGYYPSNVSNMNESNRAYRTDWTETHKSNPHRYQTSNRYSSRLSPTFYKEKRDHKPV